MSKFLFSERYMSDVVRLDEARKLGFTAFCLKDRIYRADPLFKMPVPLPQCKNSSIFPGGFWLKDEEGNELNVDCEYCLRDKEAYELLRVKRG